jgi:RimJ/RimL family protein N-acetyltransferase
MAAAKSQVCNDREMSFETVQAIGPPVDTSPALRPVRTELQGRLVTLTPLDARIHGDALWDGACRPEYDGLWRYLFDGPFPDRAVFDQRLQLKASSEDPLFFAIVNHHTQRCDGYAAYLRIEPAHRSIEVGNILFTPALQRTTGATEAMYLMARHVFEDLGYRRYEWKCDTQNLPSKRAATRLGFTFEGTFRQHMIVKSRNRDTAWFSLLDREWPARKAAFEHWLDPANFDSDGRQRTELGRGAFEAK